jgi:hypothetical protein
MMDHETFSAGSSSGPAVTEKIDPAAQRAKLKDMEDLRNRVRQMEEDVARKKVFHALCRAAGAIRCHRVVPGNKHDA